MYLIEKSSISLLSFSISTAYDSKRKYENRQTKGVLHRFKFDQWRSHLLNCGIDLGGTKVAIALVSEAGEVQRQTEIRNHRDLSPVTLMKAIGASVRGLLADVEISPHELKAIGVGTSGHVDYKSGTVMMNSNLPTFRNVPLANMIQGDLGVPVVVDNDASAQAWGEYLFGSGRGHEDMVFVTTSTGFGAGIIVRGKIFRGVNGIAGEVGHAIVEPTSTVKCGCGRYGCQMAYSSGLTLPNVVREMLREGPRLAGKPIFGYVETAAAPSDIPFDNLSDEEITGELIGSGLQRGDPFCVQVVEQYADYMAIGLNNIMQTLDTGTFVIGGGLSNWGERYHERVRSQFTMLVKGMVPRIPVISLSSLGKDAAVIGAAFLPHADEE